MKLNLLVIVPARKGSTGLKNKNTLLLNNLFFVYFFINKNIILKEKKKYLFCYSDSKKILNLSKNMILGTIFKT